MEIFVYWNAMLPNTHTRNRAAATLLLSLIALCGAAPAQNPDKVTVPLTDPARPALVKANLLTGSITVKAYDGKDVIVEARARTADAHEREGSMKRVPMTSTGLSVEEENNQVDIGTQSIHRAVDLTITVPRRCSLFLRTVNDGDISVT